MEMAEIRAESECFLGGRARLAMMEALTRFSVLYSQYNSTRASDFTTIGYASNRAVCVRPRRHHLIRMQADGTLL
jgi:hypothetical protein